MNNLEQIKKITAWARSHFGTECFCPTCFEDKTKMTFRHYLVIQILTEHNHVMALVGVSLSLNPSQVSTELNEHYGFGPALMRIFKQ